MPLVVVPSGGVTGPVLDKGGAVYNVKAYGAVGNGVANDTTAIQSAITAALSGGTVYFPAGNYLRGNITITNGVNLTLTGPGLHTLTGTAGGGLNIGIQLIGTCTNITIDGLVINGDGVLANGHAGVWMSSGQTLTNIKYLRNHITNVVMGLSVSGTVVGAEIEGNYLDNLVGSVPGCYGIHHDNPSGAASHLRIANNIISRAHRHAIYQAKGSGVVISGNTIRLHRTGDTPSGPLTALVCSRSTECTIVGNVIDSANDFGIEVSQSVGFNSRDIVIANNIYSNPVGVNGAMLLIGSAAPGTDGFPEAITVIGNAYYSTQNPPAIVIYSGKRLHITGNTFYSTSPNGTGLIYDRGLTEAAGGNAYNDEHEIHGNMFYAPSGAYGIEFGPALAASGARVDVIGNRWHLPATSTFLLFDAAQAATFVVIAQLNSGYNPVGVVTPAVPASTVAVPAANFDRTFYITTSAGVSTFAIQGGPTITIPATSFGVVRVPAGQTLTPTYTVAPTWVVEGE